MGEKLGIELVSEQAAFLRGINLYMSKIAQAEGVTEKSAGKMTGLLAGMGGAIGYISPPHNPVDHWELHE